MNLRIQVSMNEVCCLATGRADIDAAHGTRVKQTGMDVARAELRP